MGTRKQYAPPYIKKWFEYCTDHKLDPVTAPTTSGAEFLADLFYKTKLEYSAMNTARSALSSLIEHTHGLTFGNQPLIKHLLRGILKERPTLPRYTMTYDVDIVFRYLGSLPCPSDLSLMLLSQRLVTLLRILSGQRSQTLSMLSIDSYHQDDERCIFFATSLLKQSRPKYHQKALEFRAYPENTSLCIVANLTEYLSRTSTLQNKERKLLISYVKPHKAVTSATIARWVCAILQSSDIDIKSFSAHSTRAAATTKSNLTELSLLDIGKVVVGGRVCQCLENIIISH